MTIFLCPLRFRTCLASVALICAVFFSAAASANTLTGTVTNGTTNKPSAGDDVILIKLAQGMEEAGHTKTDATGKFNLTVEDDGQPHLVRVVHQDVTYHQMAPPGMTSVEVKVYDVSKKVAGVNAVADLMYLQAQRGQLGVSRIFAVSNTSKPPRTQMNDQNFEFYLPDDAQIDSAQAQTAGGQWVDSTPVQQPEKDRFAFAFPLRPGQTEFQISYHLPYNGKATIDPKLIYPLDHFVVILPQAIHFSPAQTGVYEDKQPPSPPGAIAEVASKARPGQKLAFDISGSGVLQDDNSAEQAGQTAAPPSGSDTRPGGGLGPPIDAPDPLQKYRWYLLGGFAVLLIAGAVYIAGRSRNVAEPNFESAVETADRDREAQPARRPSMILEALKEEMFQLELDHKQGRISKEEYDKAKSALDQTLDRALKRESQKPV
ncbi:MAG: carboxypeptidase regulatory-like domain-containing protein [Terriglobales bacterium]|nr:carboxypeptidase regulatory-like domain-containing protein [Terriglobales bacterium]